MDGEKKARRGSLFGVDVPRDSIWKPTRLDSSNVANLAKRALAGRTCMDSTGNAQYDERGDRAEAARIAFETRSPAYWLVVHGAIERAQRGPRWWTERTWKREAGQ